MLVYICGPFVDKGVDETVRISLNLPRELDRELERRAFDEESTKTAIVVRALQRELEIKDGKENGH